MLSKFELIVMSAMTLGIVMDGLDGSIINIAVPVIAESFGTDTNAIAWVTIVYFIMVAGLMLSFGRIADTGHIRKVYVTGFIVFAVGSLVCGLSQSLELMIVARVIQGVGASMLAAVAPMFCVKFLRPSILGLGMAIYMVGACVGYGIGPAVGGFIMEMASWHWAFFINVPIAAIGILIALRGIPKDTVSEKPRLDIKGTATIFVTVLCGVMALELFSYPEYRMLCICLAIAMVALLIVFVFVEKREKFPMLNLNMFRDWKFVSLSGCYLIISLSFMGIFYIIPFYLSKAVELDVLMIGLIMAMPNIISALITLPVARYCDKHGRRKIAILCALIQVLVSVCYAIADPVNGWMSILPALLLGAVMWGMIAPSVCSRVIDIAHEEDKGMASTMTSFLYNCGGSIGTALFASLLTFGAGSAGIPVEKMTVEAFMNGYYFAMVCAIAISLIAVFAAWIVKEDSVTTA